MNLNFVPFLVVFGVMAIFVLVLFVWRQTVARGEDDQLHVLEANIVPQQVALADKLNHIDKLGKIATAVTVAYGLLIAGLYLYQTWVQGSTTVPPGA